MFPVRTAEGKRAMIRADDVQSFYEDDIPVKPGPGRPRADGGPRTVACTVLIIRNGTRIAAKGETFDSICSLLEQCCGSNVFVVKNPLLEPVHEPVHEPA